MRAGRINAVGVVLILAIVIGLVYLHTFGPYHWDAMSMGEVVKNTALTCQDRDEKAGKVRLEQELEAREIPTYIEESDCTLHSNGDVCTVRCAWAVTVSWPLINLQREMSFERKATRGPHSFKD